MIISICLGVALILFCVLLFSRLCFDLSGEWSQNKWHALFRIRWRWVCFEAYGSLQKNEGNLGIRLWGLSLFKRRVEDARRQLTSLFGKRKKKKKTKTDKRLGQVSLYWGFGKRALRAFRDTFLLLEGTYGFDDPCFTGQVAGVLYGSQSILQETFSRTRLDLHPDFVDGRQDVRTRFTFSLRLYRMLQPCLWYLYQAGTGKLHRGKKFRSLKKGGRHG